MTEQLRFCGETCQKRNYAIMKHKPYPFSEVSNQKQILFNL